MANPQRMSRMMDGAAAYAAADKSDPFALARAITHTKNGVASIMGDKAFCYDAERYSEQRTTSAGESYTVTAFKNVVRP